MPQKELTELTDEQLGKLVRMLLGPEEEWDDFAAEFVLQVYGVDPADSGSYMKNMLDKIVQKKKEQGKPISQMLLDLVALYNDSTTSHEQGLRNIQ